VRILHLTDIHSVNSRWEHLFTLARKRVADVYVVSGDFIDGQVQMSIERQIATQRDYLRAFTRIAGSPKLVVCSGNHDERVPQDIDRGSGLENWLSDLSLPGVTRDGQILDFMGYTIESVGYGSYPITSGPRAIIVAHVPPSGCAVAIQHPENISFGDEDLQAQLLDEDFAVRFVFSGHIHRPRRWHARVGAATCFNPGQGGRAPNCVLVDLKHGLATWTGPAGVTEAAVL
jgi:Icc-related predicted phosphoesterase